jgi:hypothetical protein
VRDLISEAVGKLIGICLRWVPAVAACRKLTRVFTKAGGLFTGLERLLGKAQQALARRGDNFVDALKASQAADVKRVDDFVNRGTGLPRDFPFKLGFEFAKEGAKVVDDGGWRTWQQLAEEEKSEEAEKRVDARRDQAERRAAAKRKEEQGR